MSRALVDTGHQMCPRQKYTAALLADAQGFVWDLLPPMDEKIRVRCAIFDKDYSPLGEAEQLAARDKLRQAGMTLQIERNVEHLNPKNSDSRTELSIAQKTGSLTARTIHGVTRRFRCQLAL